MLSHTIMTRSGPAQPARPEASSLNAAQFDTYADPVFDRIASRYDLLSDLFSLGIHRLWKWRVAQLIASEAWENLLDVASGTGDIVLRMLRLRSSRQAGLETGQQQRSSLVASDISQQMLAIAGRRLSRVAQHIDLRTLDAHCMPEVPPDSVDLYSISLGLKICDRARVLREAMRVLKPGGRLVILEASNIPVDWVQRLYLRYMAICIPVVGWIATGGDASAYRYLLQGIQEFPTAERLAEEIQGVGFRDVHFERLSLGIVAIHVARKPRAKMEDSESARR